MLSVYLNNVCGFNVGSHHDSHITGQILSLPGKVEGCAEPRVCLVYCSHSAIMEYLSGLLARIMSSLLDIYYYYYSGERQTVAFFFFIEEATGGT